MIKIHRLKQPNKHSGYKLGPGETTEVKNVVITNKNTFEVHVDRFTRKPWKPKKKKKTESKPKKVLEEIPK